MASLLDPPAVDDLGRPMPDLSRISLLTGGPDAPASGDVGSYLDFLGRKIGDENLRAAGLNPDVARFWQGAVAEHPELRLPATPAAPIPTRRLIRRQRSIRRTPARSAMSAYSSAARLRAACARRCRYRWRAPSPCRPLIRRWCRSTRMVTTKVPYEPHEASDAVINLAAMSATPEQFAQNMSLLKEQYPAMQFGDISDPAGIAQHAKDFMTGNLRFLQANMPQDVQEPSKLWYRGANNFVGQLSDQYGVSPHAAAGVTAVLSPKTDYNQNASLAHRVIDIYTQQQDTPATSDMVATLQARNPDRDMSWLQGRTLGDLLADPKAPPHAAANYIRAYDETYNPQAFRLQSPTGDPTMDFARNLDGTPTRLAWQTQVPISKAISILQDDSIPNISRQLGQEHKVRNFYNNIVDPDNTRGDLTVDTHQIAGNLLLPVGQSSPLVEQGLSGGKGMAYTGTTGAGGFYGLHGDAVRDFAQEAQMLPREAQSMTWEGLRGLFSPVQKRNKELVAGAQNIWQNVASGGTSANDARNQLLDLFGGINNPPWYRPGGASGVPAGELELGAARGVVGGSGSGAAGAPAGLVTPGGIPGLSAGMGSADLPGGASRPRLLLRPPGYADGGVIDGPPTGDLPVAGFIPPGTVPAGTTDGLTAPLPQGGFVLPADTVSLLGNGDPLRGARHLDRVLPPRGPLTMPATLGRVSDGEYVLHPNQVRGLADDGDAGAGVSLLHDLASRGRRGMSPRGLRGLLA